MVAKYVSELQDWMAAVLEWHVRTRRYGEAELREDNAPEHLLRAPTGLGTSAARIRPPRVGTGASTRPGIRHTAAHTPVGVRRPR